MSTNDWHSQPYTTDPAPVPNYWVTSDQTVPQSPDQRMEKGMGPLPLAEDNHGPKGEQTMGSLDPGVIGGKKKRRTMLLVLAGIVGVLVIVAAVVGGVVGSRHSGGSSIASTTLQMTSSRTAQAPSPTTTQASTTGSAPAPLITPTHIPTPPPPPGALWTTTTVVTYTTYLINSDHPLVLSRTEFERGTVRVSNGVTTSITTQVALVPFPVTVTAP
ncbi:hypothetical protein T439DRAFT_352301 [Meredithblackwellia eburnea MCA 4105]